MTRDATDSITAEHAPDDGLEECTSCGDLNPEECGEKSDEGWFCNGCLLHALRRSLKEESCEWKLVEKLLLTTCKTSVSYFFFKHNQPDFKYCPYCGKKIVVVE